MRSAFAVSAPKTSALRALNYSPYLEAFKKSRSSHRSFRLGDRLTERGPAYGTVFTRLDCDAAHGIELVSQGDMFASEPSGRVIRRDSLREPERHLIRRGQILVAGAGTLGETELYGRSIIADERLAGKYVGPDAVALSFSQSEIDDQLYTYAFFCTPIGVSLIRSTSYGTKILRFNMSFLSDLQIPEPDPAIRKEVAKQIRIAVENRETYLRELHAARAVLEKLPEMQRAIAQCGERKPRCTLASGPFSSLAAKNHAMLGDAQRLLQEVWKTRLIDALVPNGIYNGPRFARILCKPPNGVDFLAQRDIFTIRQVARRIVPPPVNRRLLFVPEHALVVASHGQSSEGSLFGKVETAAFGFHEAAITQDILRIIPTPEMHDWLYAFLSSRVGFRLLQSTAIGTSIPMMRPDLIAVLPYPPPSNAASKVVSRHVRASVAARANAIAAEASAIRIIEQEVLPTWLS